MRDETKLRAFLDALWAGEAKIAPVNETWPELIARIQSGGNQVIPKSAYFYFLEVLPPLFQWGAFFAFAEGREAARLFTRQGGTYACRQFTGTRPSRSANWPASTCRTERRNPCAP